MSSSYVAPLQTAWSRTRRMLFKPFRFDFWLVLGFAAFLSEGLTHSGGGGGGGGGGGRFGMHERGAAFRAVVRHVAGFLLHPVWGVLIVCILTLVAIALLVFMWISSRGKFIFLDGVVHERAAIVEPWKRFAREGNSLFVFWFLLSIASVAAVIGLSLPLIPAVLNAAATGEGWPLVIAIALSWWAAAMVPLILVIAYTHLFLFQFVVPIMYRNRIGVMAAWSRFLALLRRSVGSFLAFGVFYLVLLIGFVVAAGIVGFSTCCIGFLVMGLSYIGSVVLLPAHVLFRGLGPDFLAQFGPEWSVTEGGTTAAVE
jgi:hypothetical protein